MVPPGTKRPRAEESTWQGNINIADPASMLSLLEKQLRDLPNTDDVSLLSIYWNLYVSYVNLKNIIGQVSSKPPSCEESAADFSRKSIVVVAGFPESDSAKPSERVDQDKKAAIDLLDAAQIEVNLQSTLRLGQTTNQRPRLMKLFFSDPETASKALTKLNVYKRHNKTCKLSFRPSLTREERDERRRLYIQCNEQREKARKEGRDDDFIVYAGTITLRKDIDVLKKKLPPLTGANAIPLKSRAIVNTITSISTPTSLHLPWLDTAHAMFANISTVDPNKITSMDTSSNPVQCSSN
jgi:hypothetical protein